MGTENLSQIVLQLRCKLQRLGAGNFLQNVMLRVANAALSNRKPHFEITFSIFGQDQQSSVGDFSANSMIFEYNWPASDLRWLQFKRFSSKRRIFQPFCLIHHFEFLHENCTIAMHVRSRCETFRR